MINRLKLKFNTKVCHKIFSEKVNSANQDGLLYYNFKNIKISKERWEGSHWIVIWILLWPCNILWLEFILQFWAGDCVSGLAQVQTLTTYWKCGRETSLCLLPDRMLLLYAHAKDANLQYVCIFIKCHGSNFFICSHRTVIGKHNSVHGPLDGFLSATGSSQLLMK